MMPLDIQKTALQGYGGTPIWYSQCGAAREPAGTALRGLPHPQG